MWLGSVAEQCLDCSHVLVNGLLLNSPVAKGRVRATPSAEQSPAQQSGTKTKASGGKARGFVSWVSLRKTAASTVIHTAGWPGATLSFFLILRFHQEGDMTTVMVSPSTNSRMDHGRVPYRYSAFWRGLCPVEPVYGIPLGLGGPDWVLQRKWRKPQSSLGFGETPSSFPRESSLVATENSFMKTSAEWLPPLSDWDM